MANVANLGVTVTAQPGIVQLNAFNRALNQTAAQAQRTEKSLDRTGSAVNKLKSSLFSLRSILLTIGFGSFINQIVQTDLQFQQIRATLFTASRNTRQVDSDFKFITDTAMKLGQNIGILGGNFARMNAAAAGTSLQGQKIRDIFSSITNAFVATGQSVHDTELAMLAVTQMISKGRVQSEELRGQFGERLPGAFQAAARAMGVTTKELNKLLVQGKVIPEEFLPLLAAELDRTFGPGLEKSLEAPRVALGRLAVAFQLFLAKIGDTGFMDAFIETINDLAKFLNGPEGQKLANYIGNVLTVGMKAVGAAFDFAANNVDLFTAALISLATSRVLGFLLSILSVLKWVGLILAGIGGVAATVAGMFVIAFGLMVGALWYFRDSMITISDSQATLGDYIVTAWEWISETVIGIWTFVTDEFEEWWPYIQDGFSLLWDGVIRIFKGIVNPIAAVLYSIYLIFKETWDAAYKIFQNFVTNIVSGINALTIPFEAAGEFISGNIEAGKALLASMGELKFPKLTEGVDWRGNITAGIEDAFKFDFAGELGAGLQKAMDDLIFDEWGKRAGERFQKRFDEARFRTRQDLIRAREEGPMRPQSGLERTPEEEGMSESAAKKIAKVLASNELELDQLERKHKALLEGADAVAELNRQLFIEDQLEKAGLTTHEKSGSLRAVLAGKIIEQAGAIYDLTTANKTLEEQEKQRLETIEDLKKAQLDLLPASEKMRMDADEWLKTTKENLTTAGHTWQEYGEIVMAVYQDKLKKAADQALEDSRDMVDGIKQAILDYTDGATDAAANFKNVFSNAFNNLEDVLVEFFETGKFKAKDFFNSLISDLMRAFVRMAILGPLIQGIGSIFIPTATTAKGGIFDNGNLMAFARGGIFDRPTLFPMASGMGLMGEAGPEAVMPLRRDSSGNLGVISQQAPVQVIINNSTGQPATARERRGPGGRQSIEIAIGQAVSEDIKTNGPVSQSMQSTFGLQRRGRN